MVNLVDAAKRLLKDAADVSYSLFKVMVPVIIVVKILKEFGGIEIISRLLSPIMQFVGLPGSAAFVWATGMLINYYAGMAAFVSVFADNSITIAQATVLSTMMLLAHGLPVEMRIAQCAGVPLYLTGILRIGGALVLGFLLNQIYTAGHWFQGANQAAWVPPVQDPSLLSWGIAQVKGLVMIFVIIVLLLVLLKILKRLGITDFATRLLNPVLRVLGIGRQASAITIVGMTLGLMYGSGLILKEARSGEIDQRDILFSLCLMGVCHSVIEDTILAALLGGNITGILIGRIVFSVLCTYLLVRVVHACSEAAFRRYFFTSRALGTQPAGGKTGECCR